MVPKIAQVVVGLPLDGYFDYTVPESLQGMIKVGQRVRISFRRDVRVGFVVGLAEDSDIKNLKPLLAVLEEHPCLDAQTLQWTKLFSEHYGCSWGEAIETSLPTALRAPRPVEVPAGGSPVMPKMKHETFLVHDPGLKECWNFLNENIERVLQHGQSVIMLVPEVHQVEPLVKKLKERFRQEIAVMDKQLKPKEEWEHWLVIKTGKIKIIVGTRSAVFAPAAALGAIILWEEESETYKQEQSPAYHAQVIAHLRAYVQNCHVYLVSAAPSAELWWQAQENQIQKVSFAPSSSATVQIFDLSNYAGGKGSLVSYPLRNLMEKTLAEDGKIVLFMNRKGFSVLTRCNQCGHAISCPRCAVNLTYLYSKKKMVCRMCKFEAEISRFCPKCGSKYLRSVGTGIEKLESEIARIFPSARVARYEKETTQIPKSADIIIATQAITRILDQVPIDVLAVLQFDAFLNRMDFRTANKAFSLVMALSHLVNKKVVLQTFQMDNYCIRAAAKKDFDLFYQEELKLRQELSLPPFSYLINIMLRGKKEEHVLAQAQQLFDLLQQRKGPGVEVSDPQPDALAKLRDQYRFSITVKCPSLEKNISSIKAIIKGLKRRSDVIVTMDVDP